MSFDVRNCHSYSSSCDVMKQRTPIGSRTKVERRRRERRLTHGENVVRIKERTETICNRSPLKLIF